MVRLNTENDIIDFISKTFRYADIDEITETVNIYKFSKEFLRNSYVPFLKPTASLGNNEYYRTGITGNHLERCVTERTRLEGERWYEIDDIQDLDIAETIFCRTGPATTLPKDMADTGVSKAERFLLFSKPYFPITQKCVKNYRLHFNVLLREYPSGMGVNTLVMAKTSVSARLWLGNGAAEIKSADGTFRWQKWSNLSHFEEYPNRQSEEIIAFYPQNADFHYIRQKNWCFLWTRTKISAIYIFDQSG